MPFLPEILKIIPPVSANHRRVENLARSHSPSRATLPSLNLRLCLESVPELGISQNRRGRHWKLPSFCHQGLCGQYIDFLAFLSCFLLFIKFPDFSWYGSGITVSEYPKCQTSLQRSSYQDQLNSYYYIFGFLTTHMAPSTHPRRVAPQLVISGQ